MILLCKDCYVNVYIIWWFYLYVVECGKCGIFVCCVYVKYYVFFYVFIFWFYYFFYLEFNIYSKICVFDEFYVVEWFG